MKSGLLGHLYPFQKWQGLWASTRQQALGIHRAAGPIIRRPLCSPLFGVCSIGHMLGKGTYQANHYVALAAQVMHLEHNAVHDTLPL